MCRQCTVINSLLATVVYFLVAQFNTVVVCYAAPPAESTPLRTPSTESSVLLLPEGGDGVPVGVVINSSNVQSYKSIIVPELIPLVRANLVEFDGVKSIKIDPNAIKASLPEVPLVDQNLEDDGSLSAGAKLTDLIPYPNIPKDISYERNSKDAYKMLWNIHSSTWNLNFISSKFTIQKLIDGKVTQKIGGTWVRVYPTRVDQENKSIQLFREKLTITSPASLRDYSWLSFRFIGSEEDMLWLYSPALEKVRQLTGTNRSDPLLLTNLSLDDIFGWSGKVEAVQPSLQRHLTGLAPFSDIETATLKSTKNKCSILNDANLNSGVRSLQWNYESKRFPQAFPWWPTAAIFTARPMWRVELLPKDAFSLYGRQVLYVDSEYMLPYYKFVFNRSGSLWKSVVTIFQAVLSEDKSRIHFIPKNIVIEDRISKESNLIEFENTHICAKLPGDLNLSDFDPQKLNVTKQTTPVPVKK